MAVKKRQVKEEQKKQSSGKKKGKKEMTSSMNEVSQMEEGKSEDNMTDLGEEEHEDDLASKFGFK